jgi:hypothetical protein
VQVRVGKLFIWATPCTLHGTASKTRRLDAGFNKFIHIASERAISAAVLNIEFLVNFLPYKVCSVLPHFSFNSRQRKARLIENHGAYQEQGLRAFEMIIVLVPRMPRAGWEPCICGGLSILLKRLIESAAQFEMCKRA